MVPLRVRAAVYCVRRGDHAPLVEAALRDGVPPRQDYPMVNPSSAFGTACCSVSSRHKHNTFVIVIPATCS